MRDKVKRFISILMTALMLVNLLPVGALAEGVMISNSVQSRASETETVYETDTRTVYIYVRVVNATPEQQASWSQNKDKWYTMGSYTFGYDALPNATQTIYSDGYVQYNDIYNRYHKKYTRYIGVDVETITNGMTLNITNATIPLEKVTWYNGTDAGFKLEDGATDFTVDKAFAWHLDGQVDAKDVESNYKIHYVDLSGKQLVDDDTRSGKPGTQTKRVTANGKTIPGYTYVREDDPKTITVDGQTVINVYYTPDGKTVDVTYKTDGNGTLDGKTKQEVGKLTGETLTDVKALPASGYDFVGWYNGKTFITDNLVLDAKTAKNNLNYTDYKYYKLYDATTFTAKFAPITAEVHYTKSGDGYINSVGNSSAEETFNVVDGDGVTGATAIEKENSDFVFVGWYKEDASGKPENLITTEKVLTAEDAKKNLNRDNNDLRTNTVYHAVFKKQKNLSYTVNYYWAGDTSTPIAESFHGTANLNTVITPETETVKKDISGYTFKNASPESITISSNENANVLNLYYYKNVTLTSASDEKVYDGEALTNSTVTAVGFVGDDKVTCDVTGSQTDADTSANRFTFMANNEINSKYKITTSFGSLTVTKRPVTLTSETASKPYDGTALTKPDVTVGGDGFVKGEVTDVKATGSVTYVSEGEVTNAITYKTSDKFNEDNYAIEKKEGKLSITPVTDEVTVTITGHKDTQTYDGNSHTVTGYDVAISNEKYKATDFRFNGKNSVTQTNAGTYPMGLKAADFENTNTNFTNVTFKVTDGSLTISPRSVVLTSETASKPYDGTALTKPVVKIEGSFVEGEVSDVKATGSVTNVSEGEVTNTITYTEGDNFKASNYNIEKGEGKLSISKRSVTLTSATLIKDFDGTPLTNGDAPVKEEFGTEKAFPEGEGVTYAFTGGQTNAGSSKNMFTYAWNEGTNKDNYTIYQIEGDLVVTPIDGIKVTITGRKDTQTYDGKPHKVEGYDVKPDNPLFTEKDIEFNGEAEATGTDVRIDPYQMGLKPEQFTNTSNNFTNVEFVVEDGQIVITPRPVTLTSETAGKTYDGTALEKPVVTVGGDGFVEGQVKEIKATGSVTNAGSVANTITFTPNKETFKDGNYAITKTEGTLTIAKRSVLITSQSATKTYDGSALTRPAVTITGDGFVPGELAKAEATGSITKVGSTPNAIRYTTTGAFNAANYSIALSVGTLTVTEKPKPEPRRTFNLTINYVYQNGKRAAASYNRGGLKNGETFDITSPVIAGYTASETVVSGTIYNRDIKVTVIYTADGVNLDDYGVPLGLGNITMNVGDCFE